MGDQVLLAAQDITPIGDGNPFPTQYLTFTNDAPINVLSFSSLYDNGAMMFDDVHLAPGLRIPAQVVSELPTPGSSAAAQPPLQIVVIQGSYPLATNSFQLLLNGKNVAASATVTPTNNPAGVIISYSYPALPAGTNVVELILSDKNTPPIVIDTTYSFITLAPPSVTMAISQAAHTVTLTWPASATGFTLQETSALPSGWTNSTATVTVQGSLNTVNVTPTGNSKFYRLQQ
jgi:hypothetical protein